MFKTLFRWMRPVVTDTNQRAAELLMAPSALMQLSLSEARVVASYMLPIRFAMGTLIIREGDEQNTDFMALILDGDVTVESIEVNRVSPITVTVLGPGSMHGEMSLLDGLPRSASCTASTDVHCVVLTRSAMMLLLQDRPRLGAKLMMAMAMRISERLRDNTVKLKKFVQLTKALQQEIEHLNPS